MSTGNIGLRVKHLKLGPGHFHGEAHKTRGAGAGTEIVKGRKEKSNAYFGKSLVRLACKQEKENQIENKTKSNKKKKGTAERTKQNS